MREGMARASNRCWHLGKKQYQKKVSKIRPTIRPSTGAQAARGVTEVAAKYPRSAPQRILANRWFLSGIPLSGGLSGRLSGGLSGGLSDGLSGGLSGRPKVTPKVTPKSDPQSDPPKGPPK